tara:strand:+ start:3320 stop:4561 length:1242 start_codon:yes stop_codon:yes gene_type:complete
MKKIIYGLFDVANSPFTIIVITFIFGPYFAKEIVGDPVKGAAYWQWTSGLCAITIAIFGTILGSISDNIKNSRKYFFILSTALCIATTTFFYNAMPSKDYIFFTLIIFFLANFFYELSQMFYFSYLNDFSDKKNVGYVSGLGFALGYIAILPVLYFVLEFFLIPEITLFNLDKSSFEHIRIVAYIVAIWFLVFSLPIIAIVLDTTSKQSEGKKIFKGLKELLWNNGFTIKGKFLIARLFYADGLIVLITGGGVYAAGVHGFNTKELLVLAFIGNLIAAIAAFIGGYLNDRFGSKKVIEYCLIGFILTIFLMVISRNKQEFFVCVMFIAILAGPLQSASRVLMVNLLDEEDMGKGFGLFTFSARSTSFVGPMLVGTLTFYISQKYALLAVVPLFLIGYYLFKNLKLDTDINNIN